MSDMAIGSNFTSFEQSGRSETTREDTEKFEGVLHKEGTGGRDEIDGNWLPNTIDGYGGNDVIRGRGANDKIDGGRGDDIINGDGGNDTVNGGDGDDSIRGGDGNDVIYADRGNDDVYGGKGNDVLDGGRGSDTVRGGSGDDTVSGGLLRESYDPENLIVDFLHGGEGNDTFRAHPGNGLDVIADFEEGDTIDMGVGREELKVEELPDYFTNGDSAVRITRLRGEEGDEVFVERATAEEVEKALR